MRPSSNGALLDRQPWRQQLCPPPSFASPPTRPAGPPPPPRSPADSALARRLVCTLSTLVFIFTNAPCSADYDYMLFLKSCSLYVAFFAPKGKAVLRSNELFRSVGQRRPSALRSSLDDSKATDEKVQKGA